MVWYSELLEQEKEIEVWDHKIFLKADAPEFVHLNVQFYNFTQNIKYTSLLEMLLELAAH